MNLNLKNKTALVTGASSGMGLAIADELESEGAVVVRCSRTKDFILDVTDAQSVDDVTSYINKTHGKLDILINCAGGAIKKAHFTELEPNDWLDTYKLNVLGPVMLIQALLPLLEQSDAARIINIASINAIQPGFYSPHYLSSKAALLNLGKYLANYLAKKKILVNTICPGPVHTRSWTDYIKLRAEETERTYQDVWDEIETEEVAKVPLGRIGEPNDIAGLVAFLCSDRASWITGASFNIDGGKVKTI